MTAKEIQQRNEKAEQLKVLQNEAGQYFVESGEGKILYNVAINGNGNSCTCGDFAKNIKKDPEFKCKHILAVFNAIPRNEVMTGSFLDKSAPKLDERFISNIKGKDFVLYAGVLDLATQRGLFRLEVELLQYPNKENGFEAICRAIAEGKNGELFCDIGDANPKNCTEKIVKHLIRMASTRAKGRALRDMCNIGIACLEELDSLDDIIGGSDAQKRNGGKVKPMVRPDQKTETETKPDQKQEAAGEKEEPVKQEPVKTESTKSEAKPGPKSEPKTNGKQSDKPKMSEAQKRAIFNLSRRRGISVEELEDLVVKSYGTGLESLTSTDASAFIRNLQQAA